MIAGLLASPVAVSIAAAATTGSLLPLQLATSWLGAHPSLSSLHGRVVLVDIFTFECINCVRITPNLKRLYATYPRSSFEIVAVHTPEVPSYQRSTAYVAGQAHASKLPWPIAIDNDQRIWDAYGVNAWPTQLIFDRSGRLHTMIVGDGQDRQVYAAVRALI